MSQVDRLKEGNASFAERFDKGDLEISPARPLVVLTCIDARVDPAAFLGLDIGDAHVIRNAGGRATDDVIRSLLISSWLLGTREFADPPHRLRDDEVHRPRAPRHDPRPGRGRIGHGVPQLRGSGAERSG